MLLWLFQILILVNYRQSLSIGVLIDGQQSKLSFSHDYTSKYLRPIFQSVDGWGCWKYIGSVAPSPQPLVESWVTDYKEAFEYLAKKRSLSRLDDEGIIDVINTWK